MQMPTTIEALRQAIESRDGATLAGFYADDAVLRVIDQLHPPGDPQEIKGREAIAAYYDDVCGRTMTHSVDFGIAEGDRLAFRQNCTYPDGKRVCCVATLELRNGKVARQVAVQAWDS
jgi:ketosteroid isomerase-like protein